jgi:N-acetylmuramoyl-L-alanine amidase
MTRDQDKYIDIYDRARIANKAGADLYVSIHCNASPRQSAHGWNVFFLAAAKNDSARAVAQLENSFFLRELNSGGSDSDVGPDDSPADDPIVNILNEMIMTEFQTESHDFAMMIDREFRRNLKTQPRGVDQAAFVVLNNVYTPSVLVETAFISNKTEEKLLKSKDYQKDIARSIYEAIKRFKNKYDQE